MYFHRPVRDRTATVWRWCSVAVVIDRWRCRPDVEGGRGGRLLGRILLKKEPLFLFGQKICQADCSLIRSNTVCIEAVMPCDARVVRLRAGP